MNFIENISLGVVQGLTEFLPVSSSGHLFLVQKLFGLAPNLNLEIILHFGSLLAIFGFYRKEILQLVRGFFTHKTDRDFVLKLLWATVVTVPGALIFEKLWTPDFSMSLLGITLLITAGLIFGAEKGRSYLNSITQTISHKEKARTFSWVLAVFLGIVQSIAVLPGISRSGITVAFLILVGVQRKKSAEISFLLAIPTILGAMVFALRDIEQVATLLTPALGLGFLASALVSFWTIGWMTRLVEKNWVWVSLYCLLLGGGILVFL
jgi:undecaprenyl-diphosphatase